MIENKITLSGFAGTGKSTVGKILCDKLGLKFISISNYSRDFAKREFGLTINEFQEKCKKEPGLDKKIDEKFRDCCNKETGLVIDYRLGFKFVNHAFHVLLKVSDEIAATRIKMAGRIDEDVTAIGIKTRNNEMRKRFKDLYGADFTDEKNYHLVIDTDSLTPENVADLIIQNFKKYECAQENNA